MSPRAKQAFVCNQCGEEYTRWQGQCSACGTWNSLSEVRLPAASSKKGGQRLPRSKASPCLPLTEAAPNSFQRIISSFQDVDRVLGGGLVPGSLTLMAGSPGIGKSTLMLQLMAQWARAGRPVVYVSGEESVEQIALRARRLGLAQSSVLVQNETSLEAVMTTLHEKRPAVVVVDSIQTLATEGLEGAPGSVSQVRECGALLLRYAKEEGVAMVLIGHVTKEGGVAGPRLLEHMVDAVVAFEGDSRNTCRIVRAIKNRFGPAGEIAVLSMTAKGLVPVPNPSELFLQSGAGPRCGVSVVPVMEGSRVLVVELQALCNRTHFGMPQRVAAGITPRKLALILAVLERYSGAVFGEHDVFFNIAGGLTISEPALDLGIAAALFSSLSNRPLQPRLACLGEIGLGGEVRSVGHMRVRLKECRQLGFTRCATAPPPSGAEWGQGHGVDLCAVNSIAELADRLF